MPDTYTFSGNMVTYMGLFGLIITLAILIIVNQAYSKNQ